MHTAETLNKIADRLFKLASEEKPQSRENKHRDKG
jgi:hypothetical protein